MTQAAAPGSDQPRRRSADVNGQWQSPLDALAVHFDDTVGGGVPAADLIVEDEELLSVGGGRSVAPMRAVQPLVVGLAVIVGGILGRLSSSSVSSTATTASPPRAESSVAKLTPQGCPSGRSCRTHEVVVPQLLRLLRSEFPDARVNGLIATDDTSTAQRYRLRLDATLHRGLALQVTAQDSPAQPSEPTTWTFVAVGSSARPDHAERLIQSAQAAGVVVHVRLSKSVVQRFGRSDFQCDRCRPAIRHPGELPALNQLVTRPPSRIWAMIGIGVKSAAHSQALAWLS